MNDISVWSGLLMYGFAASTSPAAPPVSPPTVVEGRNATSAVQAPAGPVFHTHHVWRTRHHR